MNHIATVMVASVGETRMMLGSEPGLRRGVIVVVVVVVVIMLLVGVGVGGAQGLQGGESGRVIRIAPRLLLGSKLSLPRLDQHQQMRPIAPRRSAQIGGA